VWGWDVERRHLACICLSGEEFGFRVARWRASRDRQSAAGRHHSILGRSHGLERVGEGFVLMGENRAEVEVEFASIDATHD